MSLRHKSFWSTGEPFIWLTGGALTLAMLLVVGLITLIMWNGMGFFWPRQVIRLTGSDGSLMTGQIVDREPLPGKHNEYRIKVKVANRDLYGADFQWVEESRIVKRDRPTDVAVIERTEWGLLIGSLKEVRDGGKAIAVGGASAWAEFQKRRAETERLRRQTRAIEKVEIGAINARQEALRLKLKEIALDGGFRGGPTDDALADCQQQPQTIYIAGVREPDSPRTRRRPLPLPRRRRGPRQPPQGPLRAAALAAARPRRPARLVHLERAGVQPRHARPSPLLATDPSRPPKTRASVAGRGRRMPKNAATAPTPGPQHPSTPTNAATNLTAADCRPSN